MKTVFISIIRKSFGCYARRPLLGSDLEKRETNAKPLELSFDALLLSYGELEYKAMLYTNMASQTLNRASEGKSALHS